MLAALSACSIAHALIAPDKWDYHILSLYNVDFLAGILVHRSRNTLLIPAAAAISIGCLGFPATALTLDALCAVPSTQPLGIPGVIRVLSYATASSLLLYGLMRAERKGGLRGGGVDLAKHLGDCSYALYLVHPMVYQMIGVALRTSHFKPAFFTASLVLCGSVAVAVAVAVTWFHMIEKPFLAYCRAMSHGRTVSST